MIRYRMLVALGAVAVMSLANQAKAVPIAYAISVSSTSLIAFDIANPGGASVVAPFSGAVNFLDGIDFRPANGLLYGYSRLTNSIYEICSC